MEWVACHVITGKEYEIRARINKILPDAKIEVPRLYHKDIVDGRVKTRSERMLPGYILLGTDTPLNKELVDSFIKIIGKISEEEYLRIKAQEGHAEEKIEDGANILVIDGPFQGCKGKIEHQDAAKDMIDCLIQFSGLQIKTSLKRDLINAIS